MRNDLLIEGLALNNTETEQTTSVGIGLLISHIYI